MPDETIELTEVQEVIEDLSSPTSEQMMQAVRGYSERAIGSAAALIALEGGGGGESLPDWWTVDSTPGVESVAFAGSVNITAPEGEQPFVAYDDSATFGIGVHEDGRLTVNADDGPGNALEVTATDQYVEIFTVGPTGAVTISPVDAEGAFQVLADGSIEMLLVTVAGADAGAGDAALTLFTPADGYYLKTDDDEFTVSATGAVTITPSDVDAVAATVNGNVQVLNTASGSLALYLHAASGQSEDLLAIDDENDETLFTIGPTGAVTISPSDDVIAETVNAAAGQTENIAEWQLDGTPLAWLEADGTPGGTLGAWGGFPLAAASPFIYISSVSAMSGAQAGRGVRIVCPRSGTLRDLCVYVGTSAGNVDIGVYTTDEPRARLYSSGSIACPAANGWRIVDDPQLAVVAGDQYDFVLSCDDASATFGRDALPPAAAAQRLPDGMLAGGIPYLSWQAAGDVFPLPATIAEADIAPEIRLVLIGRIE